MEKCNTYTIYMSRTVGSIPGEWCWWLKVWSGSAIAFDSPHLTERKKFPFMEKTIISRQYYFDWKCPSHMSNLRWRFRSKTTILFTPSDAIELCQPLFSLLLSPADKKNCVLYLLLRLLQVSIAEEHFHNIFLHILYASIFGIGTIERIWIYILILVGRRGGCCCNIFCYFQVRTSNSGKEGKNSKIKLNIKIFFVVFHYFTLARFVERLESIHATSPRIWTV